MSITGDLSLGFSQAFQPVNVLAAGVGAFVGTAVGVLPGIGPLAVMAIMLPLTLKMGTMPALVLLGGLYYGSQYGDSMAAILVNVPSEAPAIVIARDGYAMTREGQAGPALAVAGVSSFIGATIGLIGLSLLAIPLSNLATSFTPEDYAALAVLGLVLLPRISGSNLGKALVGIGLGLALATVGTDPITSSTRFTFGSIDLTEGINLAPLAVGLFGMSEVMSQVVLHSGWPKAPRISMRQAMPTRQQWKDALPAAGRGGFVGFLLGALPGPSLILGSFSSHALETWLRKRDGARGGVADDHGAKRRVQGVAGPKAADDAAVGGNLIPLLTLGIPFTGITAVLLAAFLLHNVHPGPQFIQSDPAIFWGLVAAMYLGNIILVVLNVPLAGLWIKLLNVPASIRIGVLISIMTVGVYSIRDSMFDVWTLFVFGLVGFGLRRVGIDRAYLILGFVLSPIIEANIVRALQLSGGNPTIFVSSPVSALAVSVLALVLVVPSAFHLVFRGRWRTEAPAPALGAAGEAAVEQHSGAMVPTGGRPAGGGLGRSSSGGDGQRRKDGG